MLKWPSSHPKLLECGRRMTPVLAPRHASKISYVTLRLADYQDLIGPKKRSPSPFLQTTVIHKGWGQFGKLVPAKRHFRTLSLGSTSVRKYLISSRLARSPDSQRSSSTLSSSVFLGVRGLPERLPDCIDLLRRTSMSYRTYAFSFGWQTSSYICASMGRARWYRPKIYSYLI
jgi:hypothetical protein